MRLIIFFILLSGAICAQPSITSSTKLGVFEGNDYWRTDAAALSTYFIGTGSFLEAAQDAVGSICANTATVNLVYKDAAPEVSAEVVDGSIGATQLADGGVTMAKIAQSGATTGQVIKWNGAAWAPGTDNTGGGGGGSVATDAIWDAKGDLAVGTGADAAARLAVGTDGMQVFADASTSTGLRWGQNAITATQITSDQND